MILLRHICIHKLTVDAIYLEKYSVQKRFLNVLAVYPVLRARRN